MHVSGCKQSSGPCVITISTEKIVGVINFGYMTTTLFSMLNAVHSHQYVLIIPICSFIEILWCVEYAPALHFGGVDCSNIEVWWCVDRQSSNIEVWWCVGYTCSNVEVWWCVDDALTLKFGGVYIKVYYFCFYLLIYIFLNLCLF